MAAARACAHVFTPSEVARSEDDAALERREPEPGDEDLADDDQRDHPRRRHAFADEHHERGQHEDLVRDRVEELAELRARAATPREPAVDLIGGHRDDEDGRRPVRVVVEVPCVQEDDDRNRHHPQRR